MNEQTQAKLTARQQRELRADVKALALAIHSFREKWSVVLRARYDSPRVPLVDSALYWAYDALTKESKREQ